MGGLTILCTALGGICAVLIVERRLLRGRIVRLRRQIDRFLSGNGEMLDVALQEDPLATLQNSIADLEQALTRAKALNAEECGRTSRLTADISHQLKTPLTTLRLYTELDAAPHMASSLEQIQRMEDLIGALLRLERLCADGYTFHFAEADIATLIWEQWELLAPLYEQKKLTVTGNARIRCDKGWLAEAYLNLLKNACEHTCPDGEIHIHLERTEVAFFCTVEDNGGGVREQELSHLFERFYRAQHQSKNGAGIGLAIVKEIIARHHGTITAENGDAGLKMSIAIPMLDHNLANS